ncbi:hypothetical protein WJX73_004053 [Symbiochloris irregularis]|uniref:SAYSvFN domain-containing protein n=1 Tax=Symbiochloris irregularis TaxID=706552 RepID=A0AAW1NY99_9CHLO
MTQLQKVQLVTWEGQRHSLGVTDNKVSELRQQAALVLKAPPDRVQLLQQGRVLQDGDDIIDVGRAKSEVLAYFELGPPFVLLTITCLIFFNLGTRTAGEASAYSVFNNGRRLPGQLTADELDRQLRQGQM